MIFGCVGGEGLPPVGTRPPRGSGSPSFSCCLQFNRPPSLAESRRIRPSRQSRAEHGIADRALSTGPPTFVSTGLMCGWLQVSLISYSDFQFNELDIHQRSKSFTVFLRFIYFIWTTSERSTGKTKNYRRNNKSKRKDDVDVAKDIVCIVTQGLNHG